MLVQTSDGLEDVVDMSTDNLARLKEEAQLAKREQIIRFESDSSGFGVLKVENDQIVFQDQKGCGDHEQKAHEAPLLQVALESLPEGPEDVGGFLPLDPHAHRHRGGHHQPER